MKVLSIGTDRKMFDEHSATFERSLLYGAQTDELHLLVFTTRNENHRFFEKENIKVYPTNSTSQWLYVFDAIRLGARILKMNKFPQGKFVLSAQDPFQTGFVAWVLATKFQLPFQLQIHTDFLSPYFRGFFNRIRVVIAYFLLPRASGIRVVSSVIKGSLEKHFNKLRAQIEILPVFVDIEKIHNASIGKNLRSQFPQFQHIILMASRLAEEKRIGDALHVLKDVLKVMPSTGLVIAGSGPERQFLENRASFLGISQNVTFVGWENDLISCYKTADIYLLTSEYEGYGMALIEAGAAGCPIVTTYVGIAKTDLFKNGENSFVCSVGDIKCLSGGIVELLSDPKKRDLFKVKMQDSIKAISMTKEEYASQYIRLLRDLIK